MKTFKGIGIAPGFSLAKVRVVKRPVLDLSEKSHLSVDQEKALLASAVQLAQEQIKNLRQVTLETSGQDKAAIFDAHLEILSDPEFHDQVNQLLELNHTARFSVNTVAHTFIKMFEALDDAYMRERAQDVADISRRVLTLLCGFKPFDPPSIRTEVILLADEFFPSEVALFNSKYIKGVITEKGGVTSHSAILLKNLEIPSVFGIKNILNSVEDDQLVFLNGVEGFFVGVDSQDQKTIESYQAQIATWTYEKEQLSQLKEIPTETKSGQSITLLTNLSSLLDIPAAKLAGAEGVGLFRTEFLYLERTQAPTESEQFEIYKKLLSEFPQGKVVIRTMDVGGDKAVEYLGIDKEENPFLGLRGLRYCLVHQEVFRTQLRAMLRASVFGNLYIMFPMVSDVSEMIQARRILQEEKEKLITKGESVSNNYKIGMMVEVPSAAILIEDFAPYVDFYSVGTNDLTQYLLAADRMNPQVNQLCDHSHPAVKTVVSQIIQKGRKHNKVVSICGEMAGDPKLTDFLIENGLTEFSMSRSQLLLVKKKIVEHA